MKTRLAIAGALLCALCFAQTAFGQTGKPVYGNEVHVVPVAVPTSPTAAFPTTTELKQVVLTNTNASTVATVTVSYTTSGIVFIKAALNGSTSQGNHLDISYPFGMVCGGGVTWGSDVSGVTGSMRGGVQ